MKFYEVCKTDDEKFVKIFGFKVWQKQKIEDCIIKKFFGGIYKTKRNYKYYKKYILGIQVYKKTFYESSIIVEHQKKMLKKNIKITQRLLTASVWNSKAFSHYKAAFRGKDVVLIGAGPTVNYFEPIKDAIYVGCNRAFLFDKVKFDYLFSIDKAGINKYYQEFFAYREDDCIKFIGDQNLGIDFQIPENKIPLNNVYRYITSSGFGGKWFNYNLDIATAPLLNTATVSLQALQFILYTQPKRIFIVGIDCTGASKKYFKSTGEEYDNSQRGEDASMVDQLNIEYYYKIKDFADTYYPYTEIISVNPVGLKGLFKDVYTDSYINSLSNDKVEEVLVK